MSLRRAACALAATLVVGAIGGCAGSGGGGSAVVVRVGDEAITEATVAHWTKVVERGGAFTGYRGEPSTGSPRRRALALLISSAWLIGEAARLEIPLSVEARQALSEREQADGPSFYRQLRETGQTIAGVTREISAELAVEAIRRREDRGAPITREEVSAFYLAHRDQFGVPAARAVDLIERLPSAAAANALVRRIGTGRRFTEASEYHEIVLRDPGIMSTPEKAELVNEIFAAKPGVASQPLKLFRAWPDSWLVFVVRRVIPPRPLPLARVRAAVLTRLRRQRRREVAAAFDREYRARWITRTSCRPGYVVAGCARSSASLGNYEDPFAAG